MPYPPLFARALLSLLHHPLDDFLLIYCVCYECYQKSAIIVVGISSSCGILCPFLVASIPHKVVGTFSLCIHAQ